ncbi:hypothetical protein [Saccharopolyspora gloriosae]|uniref:hypothetical protein n=1 Tax=Saccharopolyspora gloriosae TaxID=455344 RepID=UPI001FB600FA|nr:hypothetical protein [Saccharopolyspora gloriosae]
MTPQESAWGADLEGDGGLVLPAVVGAGEEVVEKAPLQRDTGVGVELRPVFEAVHLQPLLGGADPGEAFEVAA